MTPEDTSKIFIVVFYIFGSLIGLVSTIYGYEGEDESCQRGTRGGLNLSDMLKGYGIETLVVVNLVCATFAFGKCGKDEIAQFAINILIVLDTLFKFIWMVWTIVVLSTNENNECVARGADIAIVAIVFNAISLATLCSQKSRG